MEKTRSLTRRYLCFIAIASVVSFTACSSDDDPADIELPNPILNEKYILESIKYTLEEGDGLQRKYTETEPVKSFDNNGNDAIQVTSDFHHIRNKTSHFKVSEQDTPFLDSLQTYSIVVGTPRSYSLDDDDDSFYITGSEWMLCGDFINIPSGGTSGQNILTIPPSSTLLLTTDVLYREYKYTFTAILTGEITGIPRTLKGKWTGAESRESHTTVNEVKHSESQQ